MRKKAAGLVGVKSNILDRNSLRRRFRAALSSALGGAMLSQPTGTSVLSLPALIEALVLERYKESLEPERRVFHAIALGLWQHQDLSALSRYFKHLEDQIVALLIALACRDALSHKTAIAEITDFLHDSFRWSADRQDEIALFTRQLDVVRALVEQGASGAIAQAALISPHETPNSRLAYGLYCWLSTPYNWQLTVSRTQQINLELGIAIAAISAAYTGNLPPSDTDTIETGIILGDRLLAAWSGVNNWQQLDSDFYAAITAPDVLGKRF
jgi:hypothetical protein